MTLRFDAAAVALHDRFDQPEPQADATLFWLLMRRAHEALEEPLPDSRRQAGPLVRDPHGDGCILNGAADLDGRIRRREFIGVAKQVDEDLLEAPGITTDGRQRIR